MPLDHQRPHFNPHGPFHAIKEFTCSGVAFEDGDPFDAAKLELDSYQIERLWRHRFIEVGPAPAKVAKEPEAAKEGEKAPPPPAKGKAKG